METLRRLLLFLPLALLLFYAEAYADVAKLPPTEVRVLERGALGETVGFVVMFDFEGLRTGANRKIVSAYLEWYEVGSIATESVEYSASIIESLWPTTSGTRSSVDSLITSLEPCTSIEYFEMEGPQDGVRTVRLDLTDVVESWTAGALPNHGVSIRGCGVACLDYPELVSRVRLIVRYGFSD